MICKITKKKIKPFMSFGKMPIANGFSEKNILKLNFFLRWKLALTKIFLFFN